MATTPVLLPGESQGWGSLVGCPLWDRTESDMTEATQQQQLLSHIPMDCRSSVQARILEWVAMCSSRRIILQ